jgi:hypothetical protein
MCIIIVPVCAIIDNLKEILKLERESQSFQHIDFHYLEISSLLFTHAKDDMALNLDETRTLIEVR